MLTLLRVPLLICSLLLLFRFLLTCADLLNIPTLEVSGALPLARARVKRRLAPAPTRAVSPVFRAFSISQLLELLHTRLCRPALRAALAGGRSPSARVALALATPGLADGQGCRRVVRLAPMEAKGRMIMSAKSVEIIPASGTESSHSAQQAQEVPEQCAQDAA